MCSSGLNNSTVPALGSEDKNRPNCQHLIYRINEQIYLENIKKQV